MIFCPDGIIPDSGLTGLNNTHTHTHTHIYIYIYIYIYIVGLMKNVSGKSSKTFSSKKIFFYKTFSNDDDLKSKPVENNQKINNKKVIFQFVLSFLFTFIYIYIYIYNRSLAS